MSVGAPDYPTPTTVAQAIAATHASAEAQLDAVTRLLELFELEQKVPEIHPVVINEGNNGVYTIVKHSKWVASSIGVFNPSSVPIYFSAVGSAGANARSLSVPPNALIVLPIRAQEIEFNANVSDLGTNTAVALLMRYFSVQPAFLGKGA